MAGELFDVYFDWMEDTECPLIFHRWSLVAALGSALGKNIVFGKNTPLECYANQYIILIGPPATRKNVAIKYQREVLKAADFTKYSSGKTYKEQFLEDLGAGVFDESDDELDVPIGDGAVREVQIYAPELLEYLGPNNLAFISLLTDLWDMPQTQHYRAKNGAKVSVTNPTVSLIGGATPDSVSMIFPASIVGQGFLSRALFIFGAEQRKKVTFPPPPPVELCDAIAETLHVIRESVRGELTFTPAAQKLLDEIYQSWKPIPDTRLENYSGRRFTSLIKLCIVVAASDLAISSGGLIADEDVVIYANSMLTFAEGFMPKALGNLGNSKSLHRENIITSTIVNSATGLDLKELFDRTRSHFDSIHELAETLRNMVQADKLQAQNNKYHNLDFGPKQGLHCNFKLLKEAREYYSR